MTRPYWTLSSISPASSMLGLAPTTRLPSDFYRCAEGDLWSATQPGHPFSSFQQATPSAAAVTTTTMSPQTPTWPVQSRILSQVGHPTLVLGNDDDASATGPKAAGGVVAATMPETATFTSLEGLAAQANPPGVLPRFQIKPMMLWDALIYGLIGWSFGKGRLGLAAGVASGIGLNYAFDVLHQVGQRSREQHREQPYRPAVWLPPLVYSMITVLRGFWFLDQIEKRPTQGFSKLQALENVFLNRNLLSMARLEMWKNLAEGNVRASWRQLQQFLEKKEVQETTLGLKGAHQTSEHFVQWIFQDVMHLDKIFFKASDPLQRALTFWLETFRGLPVTYHTAPWLQHNIQMPVLQKMKRAALPLAGDVLWLTALLLSWQLLLKNGWQSAKNWLYPQDDIEPKAILKA